MKFPKRIPTLLISRGFSARNSSTSIFFSFDISSFHPLGFLKDDDFVWVLRFSVTKMMPTVLYDFFMPMSHSLASLSSSSSFPSIMYGSRVFSLSVPILLTSTCSFSSPRPPSYSPFPRPLSHAAFPAESLDQDERGDFRDILDPGGSESAESLGGFPTDARHLLYVGAADHLDFFVSVEDEQAVWFGF